MGRGDSLTAAEIQLIMERYDAKCMNFKDAPKANGSTDPDHDDFAAVVNEVFAETRPNFGKKSQSTQFCSVTMLRWAKLCDISFTGLVSAGDYRSSALSNWRNMISNIAGWLGLIHASERKIRPALMFNCDDTTLFLDQKNTKHRTLVSNKSKARGRALHLLFSLSVNRKNRANQRSSKHYAHRQRTVKVNCVTSAIGKLVCTVIQIQNYEITRVQVTKLTDGIYLVVRQVPQVKFLSLLTRRKNAASTIPHAGAFGMGLARGARTPLRARARCVVEPELEGGIRQNTPRIGWRPLKTEPESGDLLIFFPHGGTDFSSLVQTLIH